MRRNQHPSLPSLGLWAILCAGLLLAACQREPEWLNYAGTAQDLKAGTVYPGEIWAKAANPEDLGWSSDGLAKARTFSREIGTTAVMIVQHGIVVDAWGGVATRSNLHSGRKSLLSGLYGIAVDKGQVDLSHNMATLGIDDNGPLSEIEKQATVGDLLKARSGVYHAALYETPEMTASKPPRGSHAPGSYWHYNNWDFNTLGTIFEQQTGEKIFEAFERYFAEPLAMQNYRVGDGEYVTGGKSMHPAYPFRMTARDLARFALLYLRQGRWHDQRVLSATWVAESTAPHSDVGRGLGYAYMWWTGQGEGPFRNVRFKEPIYYAAGWGGQYAIVLPYLDAVIVHRVNSDWARKYPTGRQIGRLLWLILSAAGERGIGPDPSLEGAAGNLLESKELRQLLKGTTVSGMNRDGSPWRATFAADGKLTGVSGYDDQHSDSGRWRIEGDGYCRKWRNWDGSRERCYRVVKVGTRLRTFDATGTYQGWMNLPAS